MTKITGGETEVPAVLSSKQRNQLPNPDLLDRPRKFSRRKSRGPANGVRLRKDCGGVKRSSGQETPLLGWKLIDGGSNNNGSLDDVGRKIRIEVSARKLAAGLWRVCSPEGPTSDEMIGFQSRDSHVGVPIHSLHQFQVYDAASKNWLQSSHFVSSSRSGLSLKVDSSSQLFILVMESATKWDPVEWKTSSDKVKKIHGPQHLFDQRARAASTVFSLETELEQARARIKQLETERRSSKKKLEHFLKKLSEERAAWRIREHEKVRVILDDMKVELSRERKNRQRLESVNSKLVNELAEAKSFARRYRQDFEKERKAREMIEEVCDELAKEIGEDKVEFESLKRESTRLREEVDEERKMLQVAEVWREERVQMKLIDAKVALEERYSHMNRLIADLESFLSSRRGSQDPWEMRKAEQLQQAAASINIQDIAEFTYEPLNSDDLFTVFEDNSIGDQNEKHMEPSIAHSPEVSVFNKDIVQRHSHRFVDQIDSSEKEGSEWETVGQTDDQDSSYSPNGSELSTNEAKPDRNLPRSRIQGDVIQETPITEINEVCSLPSRQQKKASSISRLWRSVPSNGESHKLISVSGQSGKLYNGAIISPSGVISPDFPGHWSSPDKANPGGIAKGMKGCIALPRSVQKTSLRSKHLDAQTNPQKFQVRHVLKQKI